MDFVEGLPRPEGKDVILVIVDRLTKFDHFISLTHPFTTLKVSRVFLDSVAKIHGVPKSIVSDRDPIFTSRFWQELFKKLGEGLHMSTAYHPQTEFKRSRLINV